MFATRSERRPNPILLTVCGILSLDMETGEIEVNWLDANPGSLVLGMKPYLPCSDRVSEVRQPIWNQAWPSCYEDSASFDWEGVFRFD